MTDTQGDETVELCKSVAPCSHCAGTGRSQYSNLPQGLCSNCLGLGTPAWTLQHARRFEEAVRERCAKALTDWADENIRNAGSYPYAGEAKDLVDTATVLRLAAHLIRQPAKGPTT